jgi:SAM-dependent methyltransferase
MSYLLLTGRIPELSLAELESLYGAKSVTPIGHHALVDAEVDFTRLGGSIKMAKQLAVVESINPQKVFDYARKSLNDYINYMPDGKIKLGVSLYGLEMPIQKQNANVLTLKKVLKKAGRSVRAVPNTEPALSSAQTYHNSMTSKVGLELVFVADGTRTHIGHVTHVQDIDSYSARDRGRPKRDAFVGMLPPKLAQTIINIATGADNFSPIANSEQQKRSDSSIEIPSAASAASEDSDVEKTNPKSVIGNELQQTVLDPFCGTGVILQEAALMGYSVYGTDVSEKMVRFSRDNLNWAHDKFKFRAEWQLEIADAVSHTWRQPISAVACEGFLGQPIGGQQPTPERLAAIMHECQTIMRGFLENISKQINPGTRLCVAVPAWNIDGTLHQLSLTDDLESLGLAWIPFTHVDGTQLFYSREDQITHRHLLTLIKL